MIFDWWKVFNLTEFQALALVSKSYTLSLEDIGEEDFLVTKSNFTSVIFRDVMLPISLSGSNPTVKEGDDGTYAVYLKPETQDVYIGIEVES